MRLAGVGSKAASSLAALLLGLAAIAWPLRVEAQALEAGGLPRVPIIDQGRAALVVGDFSSDLAPDGSPPGWQLAKNAGEPELRVSRKAGCAALEMRSDRGSFGVQRSLAVDLKAYPTLSWKWLVLELPKGGDFRSIRSNDQAAQVYVAFPGMKVIAYYWESEPPAGTVGDAVGIPPFAKVKVLVLRSGAGDAGRWLLERRDLIADYRLLFGEELRDPRALGIRIWTNSQHTGSSSACAYSDIAFESQR